MKQRGFEKVSFKQFDKDVKTKKVKNIKEKYDNLLIPKRMTKYAAAYDFFAPYNFILKPKDIIKIPTGIKVYMQEKEFLSIYIRSNSGFKYNVRLCNQTGIIDSDYYNNFDNEGHIFIAFQNEGDKDWVIKEGDRIAQGIFSQYLIVDNENIIDRERKGGIGYTEERDE